MNVPQETLNAWRVRLNGLANRFRAIETYLRRGDVATAQKIAAEGRSNAASFGCAMEEAGAQDFIERESVHETPFHLLDTAANRRLLAALQEATEAAREVERERHTETIGDVLEDLTAAVQTEIFGPDRQE